MSEVVQGIWTSTYVLRSFVCLGGEGVRVPPHDIIHIWNYNLTVAPLSPASLRAEPSRGKLVHLKHRAGTDQNVRSAATYIGCLCRTSKPFAFVGPSKRIRMSMRQSQWRRDTLASSRTSFDGARTHISVLFPHLTYASQGRTSPLGSRVLRGCKGLTHCQGDSSNVFKPPRLR